MTNFSYVFDDKTEILFKNYFGSISIDDIKISWKHAFKNRIIPANTKGFILDYREATFNINAEESIEISKFYQLHIDVFRNSKIAILTNNPKDVVIPILVKEMDDGYTSVPFYTLEAAINWILNLKYYQPLTNEKGL